MILVPLSLEDEPSFSSAEVVIMGRNLQRRLSNDWHDPRVTPFIRKGSAEVVALRVKPFGAATHAMTLIPCLQQVDFSTASKL